MITVPVNEVTKIIQSVGREIIMPKYGHLTLDEIATKSSPRDLVTTADIEAEKKALPQFLALVPGSIAVGEEQTGKGVVPNVIELSFKCPVWTIDMLDGTERYVNGVPTFASQVSLNWQGETLAAWIHFPYSNLTIVAEKGKGAFIGDKKLSVLEPAPGDEVRGILSMPGHHYDLDTKILAKKHAEFFSAVQGSANAALQYTRLVTPMTIDDHFLPQSHFFLRLRGGWQMKPWDHIPGKLIVEEAGGLARTRSDKPINIDMLDEDVLVAAPRLWRRMRTALKNEPVLG